MTTLATRHDEPPAKPARSPIAQWVRRLAVPIILGWLALAIVAVVVALIWTDATGRSWS